MDNTSEVQEGQETLEITNQETLDKALSMNDEPVQAEEAKLEKKEGATPQEGTYQGVQYGEDEKYKTLESAQESYKHIQARATKAEQKAQELEKQMEEYQEKIKESEYKEYTNLDFEEREKFLLEKVKAVEGQNNQLVNAIQESYEQQEIATQEQSDSSEIDTYVKSNPLLKEAGMVEQFKLLATHPSMREYKLGSIFEAKFKPMIEGLMGKKIRVSPKGVPSLKVQRSKDVDDMSKEEYEKERLEILKQAGIKI